MSSEQQPYGTGASSPDDVPSPDDGPRPPAPAEDASASDAPEDAHGEVSEEVRGDVPWQRLSPHTVLVSAIVVGAIVLVSAVVLVVLGVPGVWVWPFAPLALAGIVVPEFLRWQRERYRLTVERLEIRSGILVRAAVSIPRDRIRSVDVTADPVSRIFRIAVVKIGTGQHVQGGAAEAKLDSLPVAEAESLRAELLRRDQPLATAATEPSVSATGPDAASGHLPGDVTGDSSGDASGRPAGRSAGDDQDQTAAGAGVGGRRGPMQLAELNPGWIRYAPFGVLTPVLGAAAIGALFQVGEWFQRLPWQFGIFRPVVGAFSASVPMILVGIVLALLAFLVVGAIGATAIWVETWWNYRLEYGDGVFRVRRGLLTARSISFEEARLRGVELVEPVTLRRVGVGQPNVVATGMETKAEQEQGGTGRKALMPAVPLDAAHGVVAEVLDEPESPLAGVRLITHPKVARRRRLLWGLSSVTVPALVLVVLGWWLTPVLLWIALAFAVLGYAAAVPFAFDAYRNLGHALNGRFLVSRHGTVLRRTVALQRRGVIGWKVRQSFFQRRAGIATVTATTAAGAGKYAILDAELGEGLDFADAAVPGLLAPFLER